MVCSFWESTGSLSHGPVEAKAAALQSAFAASGPAVFFAVDQATLFEDFFGGKWVEHLWFMMGIYRFYRFYMGDLISIIDMRMSSVSFRQVEYHWDHDWFQLVSMGCPIIMIPSLNHQWTVVYPLVNQQFDPENKPFFVETNLPTSMIARVYINLLEGTWEFITFFTLNMIWSKHCFLGYAWCFLETCLVINGKSNTKHIQKSWSIHVYTIFMLLYHGLGIQQWFRTGGCVQGSFCTRPICRLILTD